MAETQLPVSTMIGQAAALLTVAWTIFCGYLAILAGKRRESDAAKSARVQADSAVEQTYIAAMQKLGQEGAEREHRMELRLIEQDKDILAIRRKADDEIMAMRRENFELERQVASLNAANARLTDDNHRLTIECAQLRADNRTMSAELEELRAKFAQQERK